MMSILTKTQFRLWYWWQKIRGRDPFKDAFMGVDRSVNITTLRGFRGRELTEAHRRKMLTLDRER